MLVALSCYLYICYHLSDLPLHIFTSIPRLPSEKILLYRILGNDLPPRHKPGQTLHNVQFILQHESAFPDTEKWWIINRIVDPDQEQAIIELLDRYHQKYVRIPFVEEEYQSHDFRYEEFPVKDFFRSREFSALGNMGKLRIIDFSYHNKNLYVMNNNGGRNFALEHGRRMGPKWIFPLDGNCFFTQQAFNEIRRNLDMYGDSYKYFVIPMVRALNNTEIILNPEERPDASQEPQLIFRADAKETFNAQMRYGRRPKLELLWRLGAYKLRDTSHDIVPWEIRERPDSPEKGEFITAGWVYRLFSGQRNQETNTKEATRMRAYNRLLAVQQFIDSIDERIARKQFNSDTLLMYNETRLRQQRLQYWSGEASMVKTVSQLQSQAESIIDDTLAELHLQAKPSVNGPSSPVDLESLFNEIVALTLATYFTGEEKYASWAGNLLRRNILGRTHLWTYQMESYPAQEDGDIPWDSIPSPPTPLWHRLETIPQETDFSYLLDAIRLLRRTNAVTHKEYSQLVAMANRYLVHLITSPETKNSTRYPDHRGTFRDFQVVALSGFVGDFRLFLHTANWSRMRIGKQFDTALSQPYESLAASEEAPGDQSLVDSKASHKATKNLIYWSLMTRLLQNSRVNVDLWRHQTAHGVRLNNAIIKHLTQHIKLSANGGIEREAAREEGSLLALASISLAAEKAATEDSGLNREILSNIVQATRLARSKLNQADTKGTGLPPFWSLGIE
ncbi:hypothetical protein K493DRAFT_206758 [Basidiobolus meristosporus CBS 931.73]|uniref:Alginate lyase domain-containing protein n=1 Tax=Basidiobolus meristosporus CBS 931.73 TaxID=1314790 RepID=A0A1Y1Z091_9FUNG|nr:hypothetical protein K493DRAFT_206758 [Basidiobolus meristosporus CBS 931.73]|eukprot:ORY03606.1 hypothetical protein K493DRAFT_206758 [Basidiobolus meristosporus CBS 931.73]